MRGGIVLACVLVLGACSGKASPIATDAGGDPTDAGDGGTVLASGTLGLIDPMLNIGLASGYDVCALGHPEIACSNSSLLGSYNVEVPMRTRGVLRIRHEGAVDWLKPYRVADSDVTLAALAMPTMDATQMILSTEGGLRVDHAYALVWFERLDHMRPAAILDRGMPDWEVRSSDGTVRYVDSSFLAFEDSATTRTTSGLAIIITDTAVPTLPAEPRVISVTLTAPEGLDTSLCHEAGAGQWTLGDSDAFPRMLEVPVLAGHFTYAGYVTCEPI